MQSDPQDEQRALPESREGEPPDPVVEDAGPPSEDAPAEPPPAAAPTPDAAPPRMPSPPQMPAAGPPPSAWGSAPAAGPTFPAVPDSGKDATVADGTDAADEPVYPAGADESQPSGPPDPTSVPATAAVPPTSSHVVSPVVQGDWLSSVCPYLASADGTYRSAAPDEGHRCTAQEPAATLPLAFQERFCLTDRHPRCEMYKFAQETDAAGGIPADRVPPTDPPTPRARLGGASPSRPLLATLAGIAGVVIVVLLVLAFMGSCTGGGDPEPVPGEQATQAPAATPRPTPAATAEATATPESGEETSPDEAGGGPVYILYEIQPDEALLRVSETFGINRNRIRRDNPQLEGLAPADLPGLVIEIPITGDLTLAEVETLPGFVGLADEAGGPADG